MRSIEVGPAPGDVAIAFGSVWVSLHHDSSVARLDPANEDVVATIDVGEQPLLLGIGADAMWVLTYGDSSLWRIDPATDTATAFPIIGGEACGEPLVTPDLVLVRDCGRAILAVDPATGAVVSALPPEIQAMCGGRRGDAIVLVGSGQVVRLDPRTAEVLQVSPAADVDCSINRGVRGGEVWVASGFDPTAPSGILQVVSLDTGEVVRSAQVGRSPEVFATTEAIWVKSTDAHELERIDPATLEITDRFPLPDDLSVEGGFSIGFGAAWIADFDHDRVVRIELGG